MARMDFVYIYGGPQGSYEQQVVDSGYKWVRTNELFPTQAQRSIDFARPDRLLPHSHHGENTHLIVKGDLRIETHAKPDDDDDGRGRSRHRQAFEISTAPGAAKEKKVGPGLTYEGSTREGCRFVEGHRRLSPATAERFIDRGTLKVRAYNSRTYRACQLPDEVTIRRWLRNAEFRPGTTTTAAAVKGGRSSSSSSSSSSRILRFRCAPASEAERLAQREIARWFEKEWEADKGADAEAEADGLSLLLKASCLFVVILAVVLGRWWWNYSR